VQPSRDIARLIEIMAALRTPVTGCPWDLEQSFETIAPYTIEEAYEVADAIARKDLADLKEELGDLLLQVVYHARLAEEEAAFAFGDVVEGITEKMIRRHPHVFGDAEARSAGMAKGAWEKNGSPADAAPKSKVLADVPVGLPALTRAVKLQEKAARVGFDWPSLAPVFEKMREETAELAEVALAADPRSDGVREAPDMARVAEEYGDLLFVMANVARHLAIDPETALRAANDKFSRRFAAVESTLAARGKMPEQSNLQEMDAIWNDVKAAEKTSKA
jgi:ATP diphosphatase